MKTYMFKMYSQQLMNTIMLAIKADDYNSACDKMRAWVDKNPSYYNVKLYTLVNLVVLD